jgi:hypothetical protein
LGRTSVTRGTVRTDRRCTHGTAERAGHYWFAFVIGNLYDSQDVVPAHPNPMRLYSPARRRLSVAPILFLTNITSAEAAVPQQRRR